ncbi:MAG: glycosyl transferase family 2, partial [Anaerolineae bacterium]
MIEFLFALNIFSAVLLAVYALHQAILLVLFLRTKTSLAPGGGESGQNLPRVTVQLPLFNERYVAERIIAAACALDYPRELLHIQVLDDST